MNYTSTKDITCYAIGTKTNAAFYQKSTRFILNELYHTILKVLLGHEIKLIEGFSCYLDDVTIIKSATIIPTYNNRCLDNILEFEDIYIGKFIIPAGSHYIITQNHEIFSDAIRLIDIKPLVINKTFKEIFDED